MNINEIEIHTERCPKYSWIEDWFMKLLEVNTNVSSIEYMVMDNWFFMNQKEISKTDIMNLEDKIYTIEIFEKGKSKGILTLEKNEVYQINMYIRNNIFNKIDFNFIKELKNIFYSFQFIAIGDDFLMGKGKQIENIVSSSSGVELWIFPFDTENKIIQKLNILIKKKGDDKNEDFIF